MQTAIVVYQATSLTIETNETDLQLCRMNDNPVSLASGQHSYSMQPGVYRIVSGQSVYVSGNTSLFESHATTNKTNIPPLPDKATQSFPPLDQTAWNNFFAVPDAKGLSAP